MPEPADIRVDHSTRFTVHLPDGSDLHGVEFPSGRIVADDPISGLMVAVSMEDLIRPLDVTRVERMPEAVELREQLAVVRDLVGDLALPDPCDLDHHGYCQAHGWTYTEPACPMVRAAELGLIPDDEAAADA